MKINGKAFVIGLLIGIVGFLTVDSIRRGRQDVQPPQPEVTTQWVLTEAHTVGRDQSVFIEYGYCSDGILRWRYSNVAWPPVEATEKPVEKPQGLPGPRAATRKYLDGSGQ